MATAFDRAAEDTGNIVSLEHVNVQIPDQRLSTLFYVTGLGLTRDPYLVTGVTNMWVNLGRSQFHLPTGDPQVLRGRIGIVTPDLEGLERRLESVAGMLEGTSFSFTPANDHVDVTCPWGNRFRCHAPGERFGNMALGLPYIAFDAPPGTADGIARFYDTIIGAPSVADEFDGAPAARAFAGQGQQLVFRETDAELPEFDGHHIQIYVASFSGPHARLNELGLVTEESNRHQYRFEDIVDPDTGEKLFRIEHEVRSMTHPLYARPLVNRNPDITNVAYAPGHETRAWATPYDA